MPRSYFAYYVSPEKRRQEVVEAREQLAQLDAVAEVWPAGFVPGAMHIRTATEILLQDPLACVRAGIDAMTIALAGIDSGLIESPNAVHPDVRVPAETIAQAWEKRRHDRGLYEDQSSVIDARFGTVPVSAEQARKERALLKRRLRTALKALEDV